MVCSCITGEPNCLNRGMCVRLGEESKCICKTGFAGEDCSELVCSGTPMCSNHGKSVDTLEQKIIPL